MCVAALVKAGNALFHKVFQAEDIHGKVGKTVGTEGKNGNLSRAGENHTNEIV